MCVLGGMNCKPLNSTTFIFLVPSINQGSPEEQNQQGVCVCVCVCDFIQKYMWKLLSRVQFFATPWTIQSMEFSRPEYWSGLPFPSPGDLPNPGIELKSPTLRVDSLPAEPPGKPKNAGVYLLQRIFLTQESNWGFLSCRQILYQLNY